MADRIHPNNVEAEEALLGSILIDPGSFWEVCDLISDQSDFFLVKHQWVWEALRSLSQRKAPIDFITITDELDRGGRLQEIGGPAYVSQLSDKVPSALHVANYAQIVAELATRRRMIAAASEIASNAWDEDLPIDRVLAKSDKSLLDASQFHAGEGLVQLRDVASEYYDELQARAESGRELAGPGTGLRELDKILIGLGTKEVTVIAARPGMGKSALLLQIAINNALDQSIPGHVAFFSLEMSRDQIMGRLVANLGEINNTHLRSGNLLESEWEGLTKAMSVADTIPIWVDDTPSLTSHQLRARVRRALSTGPQIKLIMIDYLQLMRSDTRQRDRYLEVGEISISLSDLAKEVKIPIVAAAQLSRACEQRRDKRPLLSDLRESGDIEQNADKVVFLYRDDYYDPSAIPGLSEAIVAKNRQGPTSTASLMFKKHFSKFDNARSYT